MLKNKQEKGFAVVWIAVPVFLIALIGSLAWSAVSNTKEDKGSPEESDKKALVVAEVGDDLEEKKEEYQEFIDYLALHLADQGVEEGRVRVAKTTAEMAKLVRQEKVDIYIDSPFPAFVVSKLTDSEPLVNRWKKGVEKYHSVIFVKKGSDIENLDDLEGKMMVFEKPDSTSSYFLPKAELLKKGYKLTQKEGPNDSVGGSEIGYYFTNSDKKVVSDVMEGIASAGAQDEEELIELLEKDDYSLLLTTIDVFRHVVVVRKGLDTETKSTIREVLLSMHEDPEGKKILAGFKKTAKFTAFEPNPDAAFDQIRKLTDLVEKEIISGN